MKIVEPTKDVLDDFVIKYKGDFQQSWDWGLLQESYQREVKRVMIFQGEEAVGAASFVKLKLNFGKEYWLCPGGPVFASQTNFQFPQPRLDSAWRAISNFQDQLGGAFIRIEPRLPATSRKQLVASGFVQAPKDYSPRATVRVDLTLSDDDILKSMHQKTRYNIRLAQRKGIVVEESNDGIRSFLELLNKTSVRDGFGIHEESHYENLVNMPGVYLYIAKHKGQPVAGAIVSIFGGEAIYLHGASDHEHRSVMAPYFLHYYIMKEAREHGAKVYDFRGIAPEGEDNHPWAGITRFKKGFGGEYFEYVGTHDYVLDTFWYFLYKLGRKFL